MKKKYKLFQKHYEIIEKHYEYLVNLTKNHIFVGTTNEWIIDNFYLIVETKNNLKRTYKESKKLKYAKTEKVDMYKVVEDIFVNHNYDVNYQTLVRELNSYQNKNEIFFNYQNINVIPSMIGMVIVKRLSELCLVKRKKQEDESEEK